MKNYSQKRRDVDAAEMVVVWGRSTQNPDEEAGEERDASPDSRRPSCNHSSRMDSGVTRRHHHDMPTRVQALEEEEEDEEEEEERSGGEESVGSGRERLKRHRGEVAGRVWIPEIWGQEEFLKDWVDCTVFDSSLVPSKIMSAKAALVEEATRASSPGLRVGNRF